MYSENKTPQQAVCQDDTMLPGMIARAQANSKVLIELTRQLSRIADRLIGAEVPDKCEPGNKDLQPGGTPGLCFQLEKELTGEMRLLGDLESTIRRFTVL